jgi:hypothetical protein
VFSLFSSGKGCLPIGGQPFSVKIPLQRKLTKKFLAFLQYLRQVIRIQGIRARKGLRSYRAAGGSGFPQSPASRTVTEDRYNDGKA